jgi:hypothetical protein
VQSKRYACRLETSPGDRSRNVELWTLKKSLVQRSGIPSLDALLRGSYVALFMPHRPNRLGSLCFPLSFPHMHDRIRSLRKPEENSMHPPSRSFREGSSLVTGGLTIPPLVGPQVAFSILASSPLQNLRISQLTRGVLADRKHVMERCHANDPHDFTSN